MIKVYMIREKGTSKYVLSTGRGVIVEELYYPYRPVVYFNKRTAVSMVKRTENHYKSLTLEVVPFELHEVSE